MQPTTDYKMSELEMFQGSKRLQTQVLKIAEDTVAIRSLDWDRDRFDIEFACDSLSVLQLMSADRAFQRLS